MIQGQSYSIAHLTREVTIDEFIDCICEGKYSRLTRSGTPPDEELKKAYSLLYEEYCTKTGNAEHAYVLSLARRCVMLEAKLIAANIAISLNDSDIARRLGYTINKLNSELKKDTLRLQQAQADLDKIQGSTQGKKDPSRGHYISWVVAVGRFMQHKIDMKTTTVEEFISMDKLFAAHAEALSKANSII